MKQRAVLQLAALFTALTCVLAGCGRTAVTVAITPHTAVMTVGETRTLSASASNGAALSWSSDDETVLTVTQTGTVTALAEGKATVVAACGEAHAECSVTVNAPESPWQLVFSDEFEGDSLDRSKWDVQSGVQDDYFGAKGPTYWGNNEQQYYTENAVSLGGGTLTITAAREDMPEGRKYSSARIVTRDRFSFTYGYAEARMKTPAIEGMWPAFWALPQPTDQTSTRNRYGSWPYSGEIDIMEARGRQKNVAGSTLHFGGRAGSWNSTYLFRDTVLSSSTEEWHTYGVDWREDYLAWYYDREEVFRVDRESYWTGAVSKEENPNAPFDVPFYLLLNLAVGGNFDGGREPPADFVSATMQVDYVRVYRLK